MEGWPTELLKYVTSVVAVAAMLAYLGQKTVEAFLAARLQAHKDGLDRARLDHQADLDRTLEAFKAALTLEAARDLQRQRSADELRQTEHDASYRFLHEKRMEAMAEAFWAMRAAGDASTAVILTPHGERGQVTHTAELAREELEQRIHEGALFFSTHVLNQLVDVLNRLETVGQKSRRIHAEWQSGNHAALHALGEEETRINEEAWDTIWSTIHDMRAEIAAPVGTVFDTEPPAAPKNEGPTKL